jgi:acetolactate synthase-1/2/3 large subunit
MNAVDIAQDDLHIGFIGTHGNRIANMILNECDLVVSVGARLGIRQAGKDTRNFAPKADLIRVDLDEYELSRNIKINETKYHMNAKDFMTVLLRDENVDYSDWRMKCMNAKVILDEYDLQPGNMAVKTISALLPENPVVAVDVGMNQCWSAQSLHLKGENGRIFISGGYGTMGCGLPFAIGASIANGKQITYCISGDGGFQMNIQELETVKREKLPIKIFILNNRVLGKISETQFKDNAGRFVMTTQKSGYTVPDFVKIGQAYGIRSFTLDSYVDLDNYKDIINDEESCLFNIMIPEESFLTPKIEFTTGCMLPEIDEEVYHRVKMLLT